MIVESISSKEVKTRFGMKATYSFKADGDWYKCGFKKPKFKEGDEVEFEFTEGTYGKEVDMDSVKVVGAGGGGVPKSAPPAPLKPRSAFPIDPLDGQRSIIRQNCVTNAREAFIAQQGKNIEKLSVDDIATSIIMLARKFEAYAAGDLDLAMAAKSMEAKAASKVNPEEVVF